MSEWKVKKGNTSIQDIPIYDRNGVLVPDLAAATSMSFQVKTSKTAVPVLIQKTKTPGEIDVDTPEAGWLRITLNPTDTNQTPGGGAGPDGKYYMALEIIWSPTLKYETILKAHRAETDQFEVEQDIVL